MQYVDVSQELMELAAENSQLRQERDRLRAAQTWQPIETAPKDGRACLRILLATAGDDRSRHVGYWDAYYGDGWVIDAAGEEYRLHHNGPTHWMPLSPAPEAT